MPRVGVLALQGDFREHVQALRSLAVDTTEVRRPAEVVGLEALVIPGGESTAIGRLAHLYGLIEPVRERIEAGMPTFGTCAGMIFLAAQLTAGEQELLGVLDVTVERNAFGRQNESFEADVDIEGLSEPFPGIFIRAPWIEKVGGEVDVLAEIDGHPVMVRQSNILASAFHPELTDDRRVHEMLLAMLG